MIRISRMALCLMGGGWLGTPMTVFGIDDSPAGTEKRKRHLAGACHIVAPVSLSVYAYVVELEAWGQHDALSAIDSASNPETLGRGVGPENQFCARSFAPW